MDGDDRQERETVPGHRSGILASPPPPTVAEASPTAPAAPRAGQTGPRSCFSGRRRALGGLAWPLVSGERTLVLRDVVTTHLPYKAFGAAELAHGSIPAVNPTWALGQPFRGNPNALPFYPGNLLYLVLPFWSAFNAALRAALAARLLRHARAGAGARPEREAALFAALAYAGSGYFLSLPHLLQPGGGGGVGALDSRRSWLRGGRRGIALGRSRAAAWRSSAASR